MFIFVKRIVAAIWCVLHSPRLPSTPYIHFWVQIHCNLSMIICFRQVPSNSYFIFAQNIHEFRQLEIITTPQPNLYMAMPTPPLYCSWRHYGARVAAVFLWGGFPHDWGIMRYIHGLVPLFSPSTVN